MKIKFFSFLLLIAFCACQQISAIKINSTHSNGNPESVSYFVEKKGQKFLKKKRLFYDNGQLKMEGNFKKGIRHGYWVHYFENGQKADMAWYIKGQLNGRTVSYYKTGKTRYAGYYKNGDRIRNWIFFDEKGELEKKIKYH